MTNSRRRKSPKKPPATGSRRNTILVGGLAAVTVLAVAGTLSYDNARNADVRAASAEVPAYVPPPPPKFEPTTLDGVTRFSIAGSRVRLDAPLQGDNGAVAVWFHGQGGDVDDRMNDGWLNSLRNAGWTVASGDLNDTNWGNPKSVEAAGALVKWASEFSGKPVKLLVAGSMGGLVSLNALTAGAIWAPCWYGTMPVVDINTVENVPSATPQIAKAYYAFDGVPPETSNPAASRLPDNISYRVMASPGDTQVPKARNGDRIKTLVSNPAIVSEISATGEHGNLSHFNFDDLVAFGQSCLAR